MFLSTPADAVLSSSFRYPRPRPFTQRLLWGRMNLFDDRIELVGWTWTGRHRRTLPLDRLASLRWCPGGGQGANLILRLHPETPGEEAGSGHASSEKANSTIIRVRVKAAGLWKHEVASHAPDLDPTEEAALPAPPSSPSASSRARAA